MDTYKGSGVSPGIGLGKFYVIKNDIDFSIPKKFSFEESQKKLDERYENSINGLKNDNREDEAEVLSAYRLLLNDPEITEMINDEQNLSEIYKVFTETSDQMLNFEDEYFRQRAEDIISIGKEIIFTMQDVISDKKLIEDVIIFADDLTPNDTSSLDLTKVNGFVVSNAGPTSHAVIVAKNLGIPCVINFDISTINLNQDKNVVLDGDSGEIFIDPNPEVLERVEEGLAKINKLKEIYNLESIQALDIDLRANIGSNEEINAYNDELIKSVGLFRSEFVYIDKSSKPNLEEQIEINNKLSSKFSETIVFRTLDIGGDKQVPYLNLPKEENPFLGVRGIRYSLIEENLFREQIVSILNSDLNKKVKIMFPMVSIVDDFLEAKKIVLEESEKLNVKTPPLGIMVETPSVALNANQYVDHVDFFSIGTNDLIQYTYAADRGLASLNKYQDPLDTGVLKLIRNVIEIGMENDIEVSVCGDMASDRDASIILYLLGLRVFSIAPSQGPNIIKSLIYAKDYLSNIKIEEILSSSDSQSLRKLIS